MENKKYDSYFEKNLMKGKLIDMYQSATGKEFHRESISDIQELVNYYASLDEFKSFYRCLLSAWGVDFNSEDVVEVGVGPIDSLLKDSYATIVSPYYGLFNKRQGKTYEGSYVVNNGEIEMIAPTLRKFEVETTPLDIGKGRVYLTHNIVHPHDIRSWYKLSNRNRVVVGAYGLSSDKDRVEKIKAIRKFASELEDCTYNSGLVGKYYCETVQGRAKGR